MKETIDKVRDTAWDFSGAVNAIPRSRIVGEAGLLTAAAAAALVVGVQVANQVFTRPQHTIEYGDALRAIAPAAFAFLLIRDMWQNKSRV